MYKKPSIYIYFRFIKKKIVVGVCVGGSSKNLSMKQLTEENSLLQWKRLF